MSEQRVQIRAEEVTAAAEDRFHRFRQIKWWDQAKLAGARVLVVGAGALGNEVIKNLALLGAGQVVVVDMDRIEQSNLSRSVLFCEADEGQYKAERAAAAAARIYPAVRARAIVGNVLADVGLGWFRWAQVVIGALDNREARVFVNGACARVGRPWVDGGIDVLHGIVRGFAPPRTACYECTMGQADWDLLNRRRSCSLLARRAAAEHGTPTTPTTASIIGALQVQEVVKLLHGTDAMLGRGLVFDGANHASFTVDYPQDPECPWHDEPAPIEALEEVDSDTPLRRVWDVAERRLGTVDAIDLAREIVEWLECPTCGGRQRALRAAERVDREQLRCGRCGAERAAGFLHSIGRDSPLLGLSARQVGLPAWDVLWARNRRQSVGLEIAGDRPFGKEQ